MALAFVARGALVGLFGLAALVAPVGPASNAGAAILAESASVSGDSIARAFDGVSCTYGDQPSHSFATGIDHGGNFCSAGGDGIFSHAERLECAKGGRIAAFNDSASGADVVSDFQGQATRIKLDLSSSLSPRYVTVFLGHNDACTDEISKTGNSCGGDRDPNNYCRTTNAAFEREFRRGLDQLIQIPGARIAVLALARVSELCNFEESDGCGLTFGLPCGVVWSLPVADICRSLTQDCSDQRRIDMYETLLGYNAILEDVSAEYAALAAGAKSATGATKAGDVELRFVAAPFYYKFRSGDVSCCDCFHPSRQGQAVLAEATWNGLACSADSPCCADGGDPLSDARCDAEDHSSRFPGGFWPDGGSCGNAVVEPGEQCDDGNATDGDCCSATCTFEPSGRACAGDGDACSRDVCNGAGACVHASGCGDGVVQPGCGEACDEGAANGTGGCCTATCRLVDGDADGVCDRDDICTSGAPLTDGRVLLTGLGQPAGDERLTLRADLEVEQPFGPDFDPTISGARFLFSSPRGVLIDAVLPGGAYDGRQGWLRRGQSFIYWHRNPADAPGGIKSLTLRELSSRTPALIRIELRTHARWLPILPGDLPLRAEIAPDASRGAAGQCGEGAVAGGAGASGCRVSDAGSKLFCH